MPERDVREGLKNSTPRSYQINEAISGKPHQPKSNHHPTVKPISLMRWLVRLVTPPGGIVLDPFAGSGTTGCAAALEGFQFIGIEREAEYVEIAERRIAHWSKKADQPRQPELTGVAAS
jgi:site-specific DNA-methyltransferase (adenine-specific)